MVKADPTPAPAAAPKPKKQFASISRLKREGITTIFVTHRIEEVFEIYDRYTVLRDGRHVGHGADAQASLDGIIRLQFCSAARDRLRSVASLRMTSLVGANTEIEATEAPLTAPL